MSSLSASLNFQRAAEAEEAPPQAPVEETSDNIFSLIPPRAETFDRPRYERPYGLHRPVDLDRTKLEALYARTDDAVADLRETTDAEHGPDPQYDEREAHERGAHEGGAEAFDSTAFDPTSEREQPSAWQSEDAASISTAAMAATAAATAAPGALASGKAASLDITRLSINEAGRLFWDGKPVEVRRRLSLSRKQIAGLAAIGALVLIAALGAAVQGAVTVHEWACARGLIETYCASGRLFDFPT